MEGANGTSTNMEIHVKTLTGESIAVHVCPERTIHDLKLLLKPSFPPASSAPNFHLFFKGVKLSLQTRIRSVLTGPSEFLVLVPFAKKERPLTRKPDFSQTCSSSGKRSFSDFAYSDMMREFSDMHANNTGDTNGGIEKDVPRAHSFDRKGKGVDDHEADPYKFLRSVSESPNRDAFDGQNKEKFVAVLESVSCLSSSRYGKCLLFREANISRGWRTLYEACLNQCLCPAWLKQLMRAFAFVNLFSALLHLRREKLTMSCLERALIQLKKCGTQVALEDIKHLSALCPEVVKFVADDIDSVNFDYALLIYDSSKVETDEVGDHHKSGQNDMALSKIYGVMKKLDSSFKTNLWESIRVLMSRNQIKKTSAVSLEDLLMYAKEDSSFVGGKAAKRTKRSALSGSSFHAGKNQCYDTDPLLPLEMVEHLRNGIGSKGQITHVEDIDARKAIYVEIPGTLSENTKSALRRTGINRLYAHQAESISASLIGKNVVVATMTSSGKSLCYNVPVLEELSQNLSSCALYLFPTKALAQDQLRGLFAMSKEYDAQINIGVYDGDTPHKDRTWLRNNSRLLITNPDMLHMSVLPFHGQFNRILSNLRYVVIDEAHTYKGAFGCHTALILRRLRRLCSHVYGSDPSFIFCTATSANPREHCMELANLSELKLIEKDGSPSSQKLFVLWNPTLRTTGFGESLKNLNSSSAASKTSSPIAEVSHLFAEMVQHGLRCIAFCRSRKLCELVLHYTREILGRTASHLVHTISSYRGGYIAEDRRKIESELFGGKLCGIAATNALELGIDVGHIDVTLHLGFPGSIASLWQQAGRSGRRERSSLAVYIAFEGPLDQYFMKFPKKLFNGSIECCHIDAQNQQVLEQHLGCAALEHPLCLLHDEKYFGSGLNDAIINLKIRGLLSCDPSRDSSVRIWSYIGREKAPSHAICIRAIEAVRYRVKEKRTDEVIEEIEESKAFFQVYEGAVYMNQGKTYLVKELDTKEKIAICEQAKVDYYTKTRDYMDIHVIGGDIAYPLKVSRNQLPRTTAQANACKVTTTWFGFYRIRKGSNEAFDVVDLSLPSYSYESQAVWIRVPQPIKSAVEKSFSFRSGLHAACHAVLHVVPLYIRCNYSDLAPECPNPHETRYFPERILLYDQHPGGTGVAVQIQPYFTELLEAALALLTSCHCFGETGCPNCVQNQNCSEYNELIHKDAAIMILKGVLDAEKSYFNGVPDAGNVEPPF